MKVIAIVPARGGSKGIPRKNIVNVGGKPLIAWSIGTANELVECGAVDRMIVSTDNEEIAEVSKKYGAEVPFLRPAELATDKAKSLGFVEHALDFFQSKGECYDAVLLLQPTAPFRETTSITEAISRFVNSSSDSLISCYREDYINDLVMYSALEDGSLVPKNPDHNKGIRRQDHGEIWVRNGAVYLTRTSYLRKCKRLVCDRPQLLPMTKKDSINLDVPEDLEILRALMCARAS